jgi:ElaB/YqjD/DUF883 family membrane-anchored ribosome-binding protein
MEAAGRVTPGSNDTNHSSARTVGQASAGARSVIDNVSEAAHPAVDRVALGAHQAVDKIAGVAVQTAEALGAKGEQIKSVQARAMDQCRGYVRANPLAALGVAAAAGYLLSRLLTPH